MTLIKFEKVEKYIVKIDSQVVGEIRLIDSGFGERYQYFPKGQRVGGDIFRSLDDCKRSLIEGD